MKRLIVMILIICLLLPTSTLRLIAETTKPGEEDIQTVSPTAYYPFDGELTDQTDSQKTGTAWTRYEEGVSDWGERLDVPFTYADEGVNQSVRFDGSTGIKLPDNLLTSDTYSYSFWLKQTGEVSEFTSAFYAGMGLSRTGISPAIASNGEVIYQVAEEEQSLLPGYHYQSLPDYDHNQWNHFFVISESGLTTIYLNGEVVGTINEVPDLFTGRHNEFLLGFNPFPDAYYQGLMDELMFFDDVVVDEATVQQYYDTIRECFGHEAVIEPDDAPEEPSEIPEENPEQPNSDAVIINDDIPSLPAKEATPTFTDVSVHDPSIIASDGFFYAFGTHGEAAKSTDLMNWERFTNGYETPGNVMYGDLSANLADAFLWAGEDDSDSADGYAVWAPEAFYNEDYKWEDDTTGAYMIYYSASSTYIRSVIGYAVSKTIEGPYQHVDTLIYSGFTNKEAYDKNSDVNKHIDNTNIPALIDDGVLSGVRPGWFNESGDYNNTLFTNAIDANLFYDAEGKLWMTYGSWSGGIFMLEVDPTTGQVIHPGEDGTTADGRMIDRYFGTKISGGYTQSGEGPYVEYNPSDSYYYLYVTYGWLGADGGYHMRQFRSKHPEGPYVDRAGEPAVLPSGVTNAGYGNKLTGNFLFTRETGEPGEGSGYGYVSPGHNSIYTDAATNQQFNVFHTRFPDRGEQHELRVHQLFNSADGWRVMAPLRYAGEVLDDSITEADVVGTYKYVNHGKNNDVDIVESELIYLHEDGTTSGALIGTWTLAGAYLTIESSDEVYEGVVLTQWDEASEQWLTTFTLLSDTGASAWGIMHPLSVLTDEQSVTQTIDALQVPAETIADLSLPTTGSKGATITWASSDASIIDASGVVTRPSIGESNQVVTLQATVVLGDVRETKTFNVTVISYKQPMLQAHYSFDGHVDDETHQFGAGTVTGNKPLDDDLGNGTILFDDGQVGEAIYFDGHSGIQLPDNLVEDNHYSISFWFNPEVKTQFTPTLFMMRDTDHWLSLNPQGWNDEILLWSRVATPTEKWFDGITNQEATEGEWTHVVITNEYGKGSIYLDGVKVTSFNNFNPVVNGEDVSLYLGVNPFDTTFQGWIDELVIYQSYTVSKSDVTSLFAGMVPEVSEVEESVTPTAHFNFNESLQDLYGNFNNVLSTGDRLDTVGGATTFVEAGDDHALYFSGENGVHLGQGLIKDKVYTVSFWLKPEIFTDFSPVFFAADTSERWLSVLPGGSHGNEKTKIWSGTDWYDAELDFRLPVNDWSQVSFTVSFGQIEMYVDGAKVFEGDNFPDVFQTNEATFGLGVNYWDTPYQGYIDEVMIYDGVALSENDIAQSYQEIAPRIKAGPAFDDIDSSDQEQGDNEESGDVQESDDDQESEDIQKPDDAEEPGDNQESDGESSDEDNADGPAIVDTIDDFDDLKTEDSKTTYQLQLNGKSVGFTTNLLAQLNISDVIELIAGDLTVVLPVSVINGEKQVSFSLTDVTETATVHIDSKLNKVISRFIDYTLTADGQAINFSDVGIEMKMTVTSENVSNWDNLSVIYIDNNNRVIRDHGANIMSINPTTGDVTVRVTHFSTYGLVERLAPEDSGDVTPPEEPDDNLIDGNEQDGDVINDVDSDLDQGEESIKDTSETPTADVNGALPNTATDQFLFMYLGLWFILIASGWIAYQRQIG